MKIFPMAGLLAGFILWSGLFLSLYGVQATGCKLGWHQIAIGPISLLRLLLSGLLLTGMAGLYMMATRWLRADGDADPERQRLLQIARMLHAAAVAATLLTFAGIVWLTLC
ncbi:MAG: hypothetical protein QE284_14530 [Rhizobium sp.]|nr:hypothetical protein [Rhizobium sp.]